MAISYVATTNLNNAGRGILSLYLMHLMGPTETGMLAAEMAPFIFVSMLVTAFSAECFIRGSRHIISGYRDRVASLLIDTLYLAGSLAYVLAQHSSFLDTRNDILLPCILIASAFGQISFNHLLNHKAWRYLAVANTSEVVLHAALLATWFSHDPAGQFILLAFSRWFFLNVANAVYILRKGDNSVLHAGKRTFKYLTRLRWILLATRAAHLGNLSLKTLWTTMDVYLINMYWTEAEAGRYRFVKALGALPFMAFGPMWTIHRDEILVDWKRGGVEGHTRFSTIVRLSLRFSAFLPPVLLILWVLHSQLGRFVGSSFFTWSAVVAFSIWWLNASSFGWVRYFMLITNSLSVGNRQNIFIVLAMLLTIPFHAFIVPEVVFPGIVLASNFVFLYYICQPHA